MQFATVYFTTIKKVVTENYSYYLAYLLLFIAGLIVQFSATQFEITLFINSYHYPAIDFIFSYINDLGDGIFASAVVLVILLFRKKYWLNALLCFIVPGIITQFLKHFVYADHFRPGVLMKNFTQLHYAEGVFMNELNSFPSGHTTTAFAVFTFISLTNQNKKYQLIFLAIAVIAGYARIYLLQHFFQDVMAGSFIGLSCSTLIFAAFETYRRKENALV